MADIFWFTFKQQTKGKGFIFATFIFPVILCLICILVCVFMAMGKDSDEELSPIKKVYVTNHTELSYMDFSGFTQFAGEEYEKLTFVTEGAAGKKELHALDVELAEGEKEYAVKLNIPAWSEISYDEAEEFNTLFAGYVEKLRTIDAVMRSKGSEAKEEDILTALMPVNVERTTVGDEAAGVGAELMKMLLPMLVIFLLYMMVLLYGQAIGKLVISEKVSKLMETLLVTVKPYQLIAGKILAVVVIAVLQIVLWVLGLVLGLSFGNLAAKQIDPDYSNLLFEAVKLIRELGAGMAFSAPAVVLTVLSLIFGFIFYCVLS
ncbi:MAG: ABC transporter permease, partial [Lachnospiraceae bacterium]|nr:ABC transporter permease [Lachnospiraceae bacterium]